MDFGQALAALKNGQRVARSGWNGKGMWLVLLTAKMLPESADWEARAVEQAWGGIQPCIGMKTADNKMQPGWLPSQADLLSNDWLVL